MLMVTVRISAAEGNLNLAVLLSVLRSCSSSGLWSCNKNLARVAPQA